MICPFCGTANRDNAKYCDECGFELPTVAPYAREIFGDDKVYIGDSSAITVDLDGLEQMVDSSNAMYQTSNIPVIGDQVSSVYDSSFEYLPPESSFAKTSEIPTVPVNQKIASAPSPQAVFSADEENVDKRKGKGRIIAIVCALLLILACAVAAFVTYSMEIWGGHSVPDVIGMSEQDAQDELIDAGFAVKIAYAVSDGEKGIVLSTDPASSVRAEEGSLVTLNVSAPRTIPDISNMMQEEAVFALNEAGYTDIESITQKSDEEKGVVLAVEPLIGTEASADTPVKLTVAVPFIIPDVVGKPRDEAASIVEAEGFTPNVVIVNTEDVAEGLVVSTDPIGATEAKSGTTVNIAVAHNRSTELVDLTKQFFEGTKRFIINGKNYEISRVESVQYAGDDKCTYTIVARQYEVHTWFGTQTETRYGNEETINGSITWDSSNNISASDPTIRQG